MSEVPSEQGRLSPAGEVPLPGDLPLPADLQLPGYLPLPAQAHRAAPAHSPAPPARPHSAFAHPSEAEFARILDFYAVRWEYEPHVFPILWDLDGNVLESFAPDFYLPDMDLFVEMTTLRQSLVRKKNRKVRRLRELYPSITIKLLYARDFHALLFKYGRTALARELSGTIEQLVVGGRAEADPPLAAAGAAAAQPRSEAAVAEPNLRDPRAEALHPVTIGRSRAARRRAARRAAASSTPVT